MHNVIELPWDKIWTDRKLILVQWVWKAAIYGAQLNSLPRSGTFWNRFSLVLVYIKGKCSVLSTMYIILVFPRCCQFTLKRPPQTSNVVCWGAESISHIDMKVENFVVHHQQKTCGSLCYLQESFKRHSIIWSCRWGKCSFLLLHWST